MVSFTEISNQTISSTVEATNCEQPCQFVHYVCLVLCVWKQTKKKSVLIEISLFVFRYALVDFGLAQGTADTQIELLKVARSGSLHKGDGSTGKQHSAQRSKAAAKVPPQTSAASTSAARPQQQHAPLPSSSPSTASSSSSSRKAPAKKAQSLTVDVPTATSCSKHKKVSALYPVLLDRWVFRRVHLMMITNELGNVAGEMGKKNKTFCPCFASRL